MTATYHWSPFPPVTEPGLRRRSRTFLLKVHLIRSVASPAGFPIKARWGEGSHRVRCRRTMFTKQVSRPLDSLDPPLRPRSREQIESTGRKKWSRTQSRGLCPTRSRACSSPWGRARSVKGPIREWAGRGRDQSFCALQAQMSPSVTRGWLAHPLKGGSLRLVPR
jgi:hypothetical protein